jgi:glycosyltransferase involved in cell wall biosynthesis
MIAIACPFPPWHPGGVEALINYAARLLKEEHKEDISVYCTSPSGEAGFKEWNGIPVHMYKGYTKSVYFYSPELLQALKKGEFDLIHAHSLNSYIPLASAKAKGNKPMVLNPHYHPTGSKPTYKVLKTLYDPVVRKFIFSRVDAIVCVSEYEKSLLQEKIDFYQNDINVIPSGVDLESIRRAEPFDFDKKLILYVGRIEKYKNIDKMIEAMKFIPEEFSFHIIGDGSYKRNLEAHVEKSNLGKRVKIMSNLPTEDVNRWLKTAKIFVTLSNIEAFGLTVIEALAANSPVIVNEKTALKEFPVKFKNEVFSVDLDNTSFKELASEVVARSDVDVKVDLDRYSWKNIISEYKNIYDKLLD